MQPESHSIPNTATERKSSGAHESDASGHPSFKEQSKTSALPERLRECLDEMRAAKATDAEIIDNTELTLKRLDPKYVNLLDTRDVIVSSTGNIYLDFHAEKEGKGYVEITVSDVLADAAIMVERGNYYAIDDLYFNNPDCFSKLNEALSALDDYI